jgi:putative oxidoreductase
MSDTQTNRRLLLPGLAQFYEMAAPLSWLIVRCAAGLIMAVHGWGKVVNGPNIAKGLEQFGFAPGMTYVYILLVVEFIGGIAIALGLFTRFFAAAAAIEMAVITFGVYFGNGFSWLNRGYEYTLLWGLIMFAIALRGGGPYSLDRKLPKEL